MTRGGTTSLGAEDVVARLRLLDRPSALLLVSELLSLLSSLGSPLRSLRSLLLLSRGGSRWSTVATLLAASMPTSLKLSCCTSSSTLRSSSSSCPSLLRNFGMTTSPYLNFSLSAFFSSSLFPLCGCACINMSKSVVTVAFGLVDRTEARHDGQVYGWRELAVEAWKANHSFRQAPQKVCRQSRSVSGW